MKLVTVYWKRHAFSEWYVRRRGWPGHGLFISLGYWRLWFVTKIRDKVRWYVNAGDWA